MIKWSILWNYRGRCLFFTDNSWTVVLGEIASNMFCLAPYRLSKSWSKMFEHFFYKNSMYVFYFSDRCTQTLSYSTKLNMTKIWFGAVEYSTHSRPIDIIPKITVLDSKDLKTDIAQNNNFHNNNFFHHTTFIYYIYMISKIKYRFFEWNMDYFIETILLTQKAIHAQVFHISTAGEIWLVNTIWHIHNRGMNFMCGVGGWFAP